MDLMGINETKMKIVIDNYFKSECNVDISIRQAFEKGFRIGVKKGMTFQPERKKGKWIYYARREPQYDIEGVKTYAIVYMCSECGFYALRDNNMSVKLTHYCPNCGKIMYE